jgi:hypothetical protein
VSADRCDWISPGRGYLFLIRRIAVAILGCPDRSPTGVKQKTSSQYESPLIFKEEEVLSNGHIA